MCIYVYMYIYTHVYIYTCIYIYIHQYLSLCHYLSINNSSSNPHTIPNHIQDIPRKIHDQVLAVRTIPRPRGSMAKKEAIWKAGYHVDLNQQKKPKQGDLYKRKEFCNNNWLVISTPLKNMKVSWDDYSQYMEK